MKKIRIMRTYDSVLTDIFHLADRPRHEEQDCHWAEFGTVAEKTWKQYLAALEEVSRLKCELALAVDTDDLVTAKFPDFLGFPELVRR